MAANTSLTCSAIKTTVLREVAWMQSDLYHLKAVVVDTWSELGGVGRAPHKAIRATRAPVCGKFFQAKSSRASTQRLK